jgi:hypothetical protein
MPVAEAFSRTHATDRYRLPYGLARFLRRMTKAATRTVIAAMIAGITGRPSVEMPIDQRYAAQAARTANTESNRTAA